MKKRDSEGAGVADVIDLQHEAAPTEAVQKRYRRTAPAAVARLHTRKVALHGLRTSSSQIERHRDDRTVDC